MVDNIFYVLLALVPALLNAAILIYVFVFLPRSKTIDVFALFVTGLILWQTQDVIDRLCSTLETAQYWESILSIGWISLAPFAFHFACRYAGLRKIYKSRMAMLAVYMPFIILQILHTRKGPVLFIHDEHWGWITAPGPFALDAFLRYYVSVMVVAAVVILFWYANKVKNDKEKRNQAFVIALGILLPTVQGITTQVILPIVFKQQDLPLTSTFLTFFSVGTFISLVRYRLFNLSDAVEMEMIMDHFKNMVIIMAPDKKLLYMNPYAERLFQAPGHSGFTVDKIFASPGDYEQFTSEVFSPALKGSAVKNYSTVLYSRDGNQLDVLLSAEKITNNKHVQGVLIIGNDVTERIQTLKALKESNDRYHFVSRATNDMVWDWNVITGEIYRNREGYKKIFETEIAEEITTTTEWLSKIHPEDRKRMLSFREEVLNMPDDHFEIEFRIIRNDGSTAYLLERGYLLRDEQGKIVRLIGATQDITQRKEAEIKLKEEQLLRHKEITDAVISAQENERRHIGTQLYDNVNQILTSAMLYLNVAEAENTDRTTLLKQAKNILGNAVDEIRKLSHSLIPPTLNSESLTDALARMVDEARRSGLNVQSVIMKPGKNLLSDKMKLALYRIMQEQFRNIHQHAKAKNVFVQLIVKDQYILLTIKDDGIGFDTSLKSNGVGLTNIKTRTSLHDGEVQIVSAPGKGCTLSIMFPTLKQNMIDFRQN